MTKRATIKDIASLAGVSLGSVHCALLGKEGVSAETRQRILGIAKRINYRPNSAFTTPAFGRASGIFSTPCGTSTLAA